jgi:tellurite resistance protein
MEIFWTILIIVLIKVIIGWVNSQSGASTDSRKSSPGGPPRSASMPDHLEFRFFDTRLGDDGTGPHVKEIKARGPIPLYRAANVGFVTSVFDATSGELEPVVSAIESFQEAESSVYQHKLEVGRLLPNQGFTDWVRLGVVLPELLEPPYSGKRKMRAVIRMVDLNNPPDVSLGFHEPDHPGLLFQHALDFTWDFREKGYKEAAEHREEAATLAIKVGVAVAMSDGSLEQREGAILKQWIGRHIRHFSEQRRESLKNVYNNAMRQAYLETKQGTLRLADLTDRLNVIADNGTKYETVELCFDVMAGDGIATGDELRLIREVAVALELDMDEIEKMRDKKLIGLDSASTSDVSVDELLGIQADWDSERIKRHLRLEFQKWNNRISHLPEGRERDNAQRMLDMIADRRRQHA